VLTLERTLSLVERLSASIERLSRVIWYERVRPLEPLASTTSHVEKRYVRNRETRPANERRVVVTSDEAERVCPSLSSIVGLNASSVCVIHSCTPIFGVASQANFANSSAEAQPVFMNRLKGPSCSVHWPCLVFMARTGLDSSFGLVCPQRPVLSVS